MTIVQEDARNAMLNYIEKSDWRDPSSANYVNNSGIPCVSHERCVQLGFNTRDFAQLLAEKRQHFVFVYDRRSNYLFDVRHTDDSEEVKLEPDRSNQKAAEVIGDLTKLLKDVREEMGLGEVNSSFEDFSVGGFTSRKAAAISSNPNPQRADSLRELQLILDTVTFKDWKLEVLHSPLDFKLRWTFLERDNMKPDDDTLYVQTCRWWLVERGASRDSVLKTAYLAAQQATLHEFQEQFQVAGRPLLDPHAPIQQEQPA